jgi:hypothetical protein
MLPPCDTHRNPITSIAAVLLQFVTYLLTLPRTAKALLDQLAGSVYGEMLMLRESQTNLLYSRTDSV